MKRVYLVRHGETGNNAKGLVQDENAVLSEKGKEQAKKLAERLCYLEFSHLFASDYARALETAGFVAKATKKTLKPTPLLRELRRPSQFFNQSNTSPDYLAYLKLTAENVSNPEWYFADEENFHDVLNRVEKFFNNLDDLEGDAVAVTHGRMIIMMTLYVTMGRKLSPEVWREVMNNLMVSNTGITTLICDKKTHNWRLYNFNDHAHFAEGYKIKSVE